MAHSFIARLITFQHFFDSRQDLSSSHVILVNGELSALIHRIDNVEQ
jgi:hypothetical protein